MTDLGRVLCKLKQAAELAWPHESITSSRLREIMEPVLVLSTTSRMAVYPDERGSGVTR